jgi:Protein of unknown function (DUF2637)
MSAAGKRRLAAALIGLLTAVPVGVGFVVSWGAQRDAALAAHVAPGAAKLYAVGVDGLITVALVSALVLRHERQARRYSLAVLIAFSASSLALNIAHGAGAFVPGAAPRAALTALVTAQPVAAIAFGSHLLVHVLRVWFPALAADAGTRGTAVRRPAVKPAPIDAAQTTRQTSPGVGEGVDARHRGEQPHSAAGTGGTAAVLRLERHSTQRAAGGGRPVGAPGSKTEAIRKYREVFFADNGREPNSKEVAAATGASERMARKVLGELRGTKVAAGGDRGTGRPDVDQQFHTDAAADDAGAADQGVG